MLKGTKQVERNFENFLFLVEVAHIAPPPPPKKKIRIFLVCKKELTLQMFNGIIT